MSNVMFIIILHIFSVSAGFTFCLSPIVSTSFSKFLNSKLNCLSWYFLCLFWTHSFNCTVRSYVSLVVCQCEKILGKHPTRKDDSWDFVPSRHVICLEIITSDISSDWVLQLARQNLTTFNTIHQVSGFYGIRIWILCVMLFSLGNLAHMNVKLLHWPHILFLWLHVLNSRDWKTWCVELVLAVRLFIYSTHSNELT